MIFVWDWYGRKEKVEMEQWSISCVKELDLWGLGIHYKEKRAFRPVIIAGSKGELFALIDKFVELKRLVETAEMPRWIAEIDEILKGLE